MTWQRDTKGMLGFAITITSAHASPCHMEARAHRFVGRFLQALSVMPAAVFHSNREAAVANRLRDDVNLSDESARIVNEIHSEQYCFDRAEREAAEMRGVTQPQLVAWARQALLHTEQHRLSVHAYRGSLDHSPSDEKLPPRTSAIAQAAEFRRGLEAHRRERKPLP